MTTQRCYQSIDERVRKKFEGIAMKGNLGEKIKANISLTKCPSIKLTNNKFVEETNIE